LETLLAMMIASTALAGAVLMAFGARALVDDARQGFEALDLAQRLLADQENLAHNDFRLANGIKAQEGIFSGAVNVSRHSFFEKIARAEVEWSAAGRSQKIALETLIADYGQTAGNDTCDSFLTGDWKNPQIIKTIDFSDFAESASSTYAIGDIDVYKNKLYVAMEKTGTKTDSTFFIFDVSDPLSPLLLSKIDNNSAAMSGINDMAINGNYAYTASIGVKQLQIIDVSAMPSQIIYEDKIPDGGNGLIVFYKSGYIYLGLAKKAGIAEFYVFNVKNLSNIFAESFLLIDGGINDIYVKGDYAYLAHPADLASPEESGREQLTILNIADLANPYRVGGFYYDKGSFDASGKSLYVIGSNIYLGRTRSHISGPPDTIPEFFILDGEDATSITTLGSWAFSRVGSVNGLIVRDNLAFILLGTANLGGDLRILNIDAPDNIIGEKIIDLPGIGGGVGGAAMDCEGNHLYVASIDGAGKSYVSIITAQ